MVQILKSQLVLLVLGITQVVFAAENNDLAFTGISKVKVRNGSGNVRVTGDAKTTTAVVHFTKKKFSDTCRLDIVKDQETLLVEVKKQPASSKDVCEVDFSIAAPSRVDISSKIGSGNLKVRNTIGDLKSSLGTGAVDIDAIVHKLKVNSGSGAITVVGLTAGGDIRVGSGEVTLTYSDVPKRGDLDVHTGSGNLTVYLPQGSKVHSDFKSGVGKFISNEFVDVPESDFEISMRSGVGNLTLAKKKH